MLDDDNVTGITMATACKPRAACQRRWRHGAAKYQALHSRVPDADRSRKEENTSHKSSPKQLRRANRARCASPSPAADIGVHGSGCMDGGGGRRGTEAERAPPPARPPPCLVISPLTLALLPFAFSVRSSSCMFPTLRNYETCPPCVLKQRLGKRDPANATLRLDRS
jgi:hypothetical protein